MPLGLFPRETSDILAGGLDTGTTPPPTPGFFTGVLGAAAQGIPRGLEEVEQAGATAVTSGIAALVAPMRERLFQAGAMGMPIPETTPQIIASPPGDIERQMAIASAHAVARYTPNPHTTGLAGQTLNGLVSGITQFVGGTALAGPAGGAIAVGTAAGTQTRNELIAGGVDTATANKLGVGSGLFSGAASLLPGGVGKTLAERVATGAGIQQIAGAANRLLMHTVLEDAGYKDMAQQYRPFDGASLLADAVLGAGFGGVHHIFTPGAVDAARSIKDAVHVEDAAGGPAVDPVSRTNIVGNHRAATDALVSGAETPPTMGDVRIVPDTAQEASRAASARGMDEAAAEAGARPVPNPDELPVVLYHGTNAVQFDRFDESRSRDAGIWLTPVRGMAELYGDRIITAAAKIENPYEAKIGESRQESIIKAMDGGHDGIIVRNENGSISAVMALSGEKIRIIDQGIIHPVLDPATAEIVGQAQEALTRHPDLKIDGTDMAAELQRSLDDVKAAKAEGDLHHIAAACFGRV